MTKETKQTIFQNVISELLKADVNFDAHYNRYSTYEIHCYGDNVEKAMSMQLGFERKVQVHSNGVKFYLAALSIPANEGLSESTQGAFI